jgi:hypothetical protein
MVSAAEASNRSDQISQIEKRRTRTTAGSREGTAPRRAPIRRLHRPAASSLGDKQAALGYPLFKPPRGARVIPRKQLMNTISNIQAMITVARLESFSAAARALRTAPSVITKRITQLEKEAGSRLINRSTPGPALTAAGERMLTDRQREMSRAIAERTGIDDAMIERLVRTFYGKVRTDGAPARCYARHEARRPLYERARLWQHHEHRVHSNATPLLGHRGCAARGPNLYGCTLVAQRI